MIVQAVKNELLAHADEIVRDPNNATIHDVAILILAILILLARPDWKSTHRVPVL
jgi:hypothetical protein